MTLEELGNLGDFLGGIGVIVTLVYLAVQIRSNTQTVRVASLEAVVNSRSQFLDRLRSGRITHMVLGAVGGRRTDARGGPASSRTPLLSRPEVGVRLLHRSNGYDRAFLLGRPSQGVHQRLRK